MTDRSLAKGGASRGRGDPWTPFCIVDHRMVKAGVYHDGAVIQFDGHTFGSPNSLHDQKDWVEITGWDEGKASGIQIQRDYTVLIGWTRGQSEDPNSVVDRGGITFSSAHLVLRAGIVDGLCVGAIVGGVADSITIIIQTVIGGVKLTT